MAKIPWRLAQPGCVVCGSLYPTLLCAHDKIKNRERLKLTIETVRALLQKCPRCSTRPCACPGSL